MSYSEPVKVSYNEILQQVGEKKFRERLTELTESANAFIEAAGYKGNVECNERIMLNVLFDYFSDIFRLKEFHHIEHVKIEKIVAYTAAWILRRKPLQFVRYTDEEKDMFVNERFALYFVLNECFGSGKLCVTSKYQQALDNYIDMLLYYFKYRECNPQVIELAIESFKMGTLVERV